MLIFKRFIVWTILFGITTTQFLLYLPNFSCTSSIGLPICTEQFSFSIIGTSTITRDFIASVKEFLKLVSYLAIDMGWSNSLADPEIYNDENLVDTFESENIYRVNYFGYCKKNNNQRMYCVPNGNAGMDVLTILVRDVGIQLGKLSSVHVNNTTILGDSLVLTYQLALSSLRKFLKGDRYRGNALSKVIFGSDINDTETTGRDKAAHYSKGVDAAYFLSVANKIMFLLQVCEVVTSFLCLLTVIGFGMGLTLTKKHRSLPVLLKVVISTLLIIASITLISSVLYFLSLKTLEPSNDPSHGSTGWELLQVNIGNGFIIGCVRYLVQLTLLPVAFLTANHYSVKKKVSQHSADSLSSNSVIKDDV